jgi:hypothetical protein
LNVQDAKCCEGKPEATQRGRRGSLLVELCVLLKAVQPEDVRTVSTLLVSWLDDAGAGMPELDVFGDLRGDARFWADIAHPAELEAYVAAGIRRLERTQLSVAARKRLFVAFWEVMADADRRKFLERADPAGTFSKVKP